MTDISYCNKKFMNLVGLYLYGKDINELLYKCKLKPLKLISDEMYTMNVNCDRENSIRIPMLDYCVNPVNYNLEIAGGDYSQKVLNNLLFDMLKDIGEPVGQLPNERRMEDLNLELMVRKGVPEQEGNVFANENWFVLNSEQNQFWSRFIPSINDTDKITFSYFHVISGVSSDIESFDISLDEIDEYKDTMYEYIYDDLKLFRIL